MTSDIVAMSHKESINEAVKVMIENEIGSIPVLSDDDKIVELLQKRLLLYLWLVFNWWNCSRCND